MPEATVPSVARKEVVDDALGALVLDHHVGDVTGAAQQVVTVRADTSAASPRLCHPRHRPPSLRQPTLDHTTTVTEGG
jgi:hypothetical protein